MDKLSQDRAARLIVQLLRGFYWFDEGLQAYLRQKGWPSVTRSQSMLMISVLLGARRPSQIARALGVSRQAIHTSLNGMIELGILSLADDPEDGRSKIVVITGQGGRMRENADEAMRLMAEELARRIGQENLAALAQALSADWGPPLDRFDDGS
ncbi:MAG: MarR family winged helix-turn-helix transcriptional regulator [Caulobacteraceae bacterium]|nr:MarR family winged helix-turn-helix transcriptional regulator [Caulobacteraceae bacterium]